MPPYVLPLLVGWLSRLPWISQSERVKIRLFHDNVFPVFIMIIPGLFCIQPVQTLPTRLNKLINPNHQLIDPNH